MAIYADKKDGKVTGRWRVELQQGGVRVRQRFDTLEQAQEFEARSRIDLARGTVPSNARARVVPEKTVSTLSALCRAVEGHLWAGDSSERQAHQRLEGACRIIGPLMLVESVTVADIDRLVKVLRDRQSAPGTINRYLSAFNSALKWALKRGYRTSPLPTLEWQDEDEGRIRWITPEEEARLMDLMARPEALAAYVCIRTGLRRGELLNLRARDVEKGWVRLWGTGTKNGKGRSVPLAPETYLALLELLRHGMPTQESLRYQWNQAKKLMDLADDDEFVFHATRHTFATRAVQAGVHPRVLQRLMGHKHLSTTMRYMQVSDTMLEAAISQMGEPHSSYIHSENVGSKVGACQGGGIALNPPKPPPGQG
jgi:integrase